MVDWRQVKQWLHKNDFFERTPLNGWAYIYAANGIKEIAFWYIIILALSVLTVSNVNQVTQYYLSEPTKYIIHMDVSSDQMEIPQLLTLRMTADFFDWRDTLPLQVRVKEKPSSGIWSEYFSSEQNNRFRIFRDFFCQTGYQEALWLVEIAGDATEPEFLKSFYDSVVVNRSSALADFSDPRILYKWKDEMEKAKRDYYEYWVSVLTIPTYQQNRTLIGNRLTQIQDSQITRRPVDALIKLLAIKAVQSGEDDVLAKLGFTKDDLIIEKFNATATQLVQDIVADSANIIHFEMKPQGSVSLVDWTHVLSAVKQEYKFLVKTPPGTKNLHLRIYQRSFMWLKHVLHALDALTKTFLKPLSSAQDDALTKLKCGIDHYMTFESVIMDIFDEWIWTYMDDYVYVSDAQSGWQVIAESNYYNHFSLVPHTVFKSTVDGCHNESLEWCKRQCIGSKAAAKCSCVPWNLANLIDSSEWPNEEICDKHCAQEGIVEQCDEQCGQKINQSCTVQFTHIKGELHEFNDHLSDGFLHKMDINISVPEFYPHAKQFKEYELTANGYLSLLGGAIEFWSAMGVLGLIHLVIFIVIGLYRILKVKQKSGTEVLPQDTAMTLESIEQKYANAMESLNEGHVPRWKRIIKWLKGNRFYEQTPFAGYSYITEAESVIEIMIWYGIIALFATLAAYNLHGNINDYISRTTKVNIVPSTEKTPLPNATLNMVLPIVMLAEFDARVNYNIREEQSESDFRATIRRTEREANTVDVQNVSKQLVDHWKSLIDSPSGDLFTLNKSEQAFGSLSHGDDFEKRMSFAQSIARLDDWMAAHNLSWSELQLPSSEIMSGPRTGVDGLVFTLLLLRAIKTGEPVLQQLGGSGPLAKEILEQEGCTTEQLYNVIIGQLSHVLNVRGAQTRISDVDFDEQYLEKGTFALQVELEFPPGAKSAYIHVDSLVFQWIIAMLRYYKDMSYYGLMETTKKSSLNFETFFEDFLSYYYWFHWITFATLSAPTADMPVITSSYGTDAVFNGIIQDYSLYTQWTYHSAKDICPYENQQLCMDDCVQQQYLSSCGCLPWSVMEPNEQHPLCLKPCEIKTSKCHTECRNHFCDQHAHKFVSNNFKVSSSSVDVLGGSLFEFRFSVMQNLHMRFVETYEYSLGTFLAQIGGLLEFWLGCNAIALLHCMAYLFKYIYYLSAKRDTSSVQNRLERRLQQIHDLHGQLCIDITAAREAAQNGTLRETDHSEIHWLYKNRFYETTSITGFKFIANARLGLERLFWAVLILIFFVITVYNVYTTIEYYGQKPTLLSTKVVHGNPIQLGNLTLQFRANIIEFTQEFPTVLHHRDSMWSNSVITDNFACDLTDIEDNENVEIELKTRFIALYHLMEFEHWTLNQTEWPKVPPVESSEKILQNWQERFQKKSKALLGFWERYKSKPMPQYTSERQSVQLELAELLNAPLKERNLSFLHGFFLLEAFNTGSNPQAKLLELSQKAFGSEWSFNDFKPTGQTISELLGGVSAFELVKRMEQELNKMILIHVIDEPDAQISLQGWSYGSENTSHNINGLLYHNLEYHVILPENHSRTQVQIATYSFLRMWHNYVMDSMYEHFKQNNRLSEEFSCKGLFDNIENMMSLGKNNFLYLIMDTFSEMQDLYIGTENFDLVTSYVLLAPQEIILHVTGSFDSNTHNCSTISSQQSLDHCVRHYSLETCGCQPWGLLYLDEEGPVCTAPCNQPTHCLQQCQQTMQQPCHFVQSKAERTHSELKGHESYSTMLDTAQHRVVIKSKGKSYIGHTESYETVGSFIAQLGSFLDLWLGFNLLSIIHLLVFIMKQVFRKSTCGLKSNTVASTEPSLLVQIELMEKRISENIRLVHKDTQLKIMKEKAKKPDM